MYSTVLKNAYLVVVLTLVGTGLLTSTLAQDGGPDGGPAPVPVPTVKPVEPPKPVKPKALQLDPSNWLVMRQKLLRDYETFIQAQFARPDLSIRPTENAFVQWVREYISDKHVVKYLGIKRFADIAWTYPLPDTTDDVEDLESEIVEDLRTEAEEKFPKKSPEEYRAEAEEEYKLYKPGDKVDIPLPTGDRGRAASIKGTLVIAKGQMIQLRNPRRFVPRGDLTREIAARFFEDAHKEMVNDTVENAERRIDFQRQNYIDTERRRQLRQRLIEANYVPDHIDYPEEVQIKLLKPQHWLSRKALVLKQQRFLWEQNNSNDGKSVLSQMQYKYMQANGFIEAPHGTSSSNNDNNSYGNNSSSVGVTAELFKLALPEAEAAYYTGWIPIAHIELGREWLIQMDKYERDMAEYPAKLAEYKQQLEAWNNAQKANAAANEDDDE